ncbi:MAG TPA: ABC transporter permease [Firmicutes bacterium]|nr:ABC transporter permease [Bacillota bacterium]
MSLIVALQAIVRRNITMMTRYIFNTLSGFVSIYLIFCFIFFGMKAFAKPGPSLDSSLEGTVVGFFVWTLALFAFSELSWDLINEAQTGTLEQLYLAPCGFKWLSIFNLLTNLTVNIVASTILLLAMMATTGRWLNLDIISIVPLLLMTVLTAYGVGFALGGLALIFKRIQAFFQIMQFVFIGCLVIPWRLAWAKFLPLSLGNALIYRIMADGVRLWELPLGDVLMATGIGLGYLTLGLLVFSACERAAKGRGLLGHY